MSGKDIQTVIISRTDAIGDVVLTLPMASLIKDLLGQNVKIIFFGKTYTEPVIACCEKTDQFINYDTFTGLDKKGRIDFLKQCNADAIIHVFPRSDIAKAAKAAGIPERIGTSHRFYHWLNCNGLVSLGRKNSTLHESQLNIQLLKPFGHSGNISLIEIPGYYHFKNKYSLPGKISDILSRDKFRLVIHPKSNSSAREWKMDHYFDLIKSLPENKFQIIISGGKNEASFLNEWVKTLPPHVVNLAGKLSLEELVALLDSCSGIIAASTGPLHIASALGKFALGIFPPIHPMHPGRWSPVGTRAEFLVVTKECSECRNLPGNCHCINEVTPQMAQQRILQWIS